MATSRGGPGDFDYNADKFGGRINNDRGPDMLEHPSTYAGNDPRKISAKTVAGFNAAQRKRYLEAMSWYEPDAPMGNAPLPPRSGSVDVMAPIRDIVPGSVAEPGDNPNTTGPTLPEEARRQKFSDLKLDPTRDRPVLNVRREPVAKRADDKPVDNRQTCKPRPKENKPSGAGAGGSFKAFIPWCDRS